MQRIAARAAKRGARLMAQRLTIHGTSHWIIRWPVLLSNCARRTDAIGIDDIACRRRTHDIDCPSVRTEFGHIHACWLEMSKAILAGLSLGRIL